MSSVASRNLFSDRASEGVHPEPPGTEEEAEAPRSTIYASYIPLELFRDGNPSEIRIFCALASFQGRKARCWPSYRSISDRSGVRINHIPQYLRSLEEKGWIKRTRRGKRRTNIYTVWRPSADWAAREGAHPEECGDHPSVGCSDHPSMGCDDHPTDGWSSRESNKEKEEEEKRALRAPAAPPPERHRLTDEEFARLDDQLFIPHNLRARHKRYRQIVRSEGLLEKHGVQRVQTILNCFASDAEEMPGFNPATGPGLFLRKIRDGEYDLPDRNFAADDRAKEEANLRAGVTQWLFWLENPGEHEEAQQEAGLSQLNPWRYGSLDLPATVAKGIHLATRGLPEGAPPGARKKAEDEFAFAWETAEGWAKHLIRGLYQERLASAGAGPDQDCDADIVQLLTAGVN